MGQPLETSGVATGASQGVADHQPLQHQQAPIPPTPEPQQQPQYRPQSQGPSRSDLLAAIESLPERISTTLREVMAPKPTPPTPPAESQGNQQQNQGQQSPPAQQQEHRPQRGPKTFLEWYTGEIRD